ncbi:S1C family serine protease [Hathewaya limosa]|uniref:Serine protease Do n=1 Tax=Hathewaya limosa TaxID=1536 RepID=A0ABU0JQI4_HATLI|nr:trypsin-like peptidase domain-containing protein [Hathewaya limosa]MDQ0478433.1 serine protease Do [Hathewaya limosa]
MSMLDNNKDNNINNSEINENLAKEVKEEMNNHNDSFNNDNTEQFAKNHFTEDFPYEKPNKKKKNGSKILIYVLIAVLSSTVGGIASSVATVNYLKSNTEITEKTPANNGSNVLNSNKSPNSLSELSVPEVIKKVGPAVVGISTKGFPQNVGWGFEVAGQEGLGSGIIFDKQGYILTNNHVVEGAQTISVIFNNGKEVKAKLINTDPNYDVAVLKITDHVEVPAVAEFGDSDKLNVGETAIAIGNPLGKDLLGSVTTGVISAVNRSIDARNKDLKMIQTDAAINPGNSGGPLVNSKGQVIGINTEKRVGNGVEGLGFAIPINQIKPKIQSLMTPKLMFGIVGRTVTEQDSKYYNIPIGVFITDIQQYSPAEKAGLKPGDIILEINGKKIKNNEELNKTKENHKAGDILNIKLFRDNQKINIKLTLQELK